jgi:hypothetical protein
MWFGETLGRNQCNHDSSPRPLFLSGFQIMSPGEEEIVSIGYIYRRRKRAHMRAATLVGILLVLIGIAGFAVGGISFTHEKKDVNLGPVQVSHEKKETVPISPILSTVSLVAGIGLLIAGARAK